MTLTPRQLQRRLKAAGATVPLTAIMRWSPAKQILALRWATVQIEAHAHDRPGSQTSVAWPAHVSAANTRTRR